MIFAFAAFAGCDDTNFNEGIEGDTIATVLENCFAAMLERLRMRRWTWRIHTTTNASRIRANFQPLKPEETRSWLRAILKPACSTKGSWTKSRCHPRVQQRCSAIRTGVV